MNRMNLNRRAFTLIELIAVIVILGLLAGVALPKYFDHAASAKTAAAKGGLGGIRSGITNFFANAAINGSAAYPTLLELTTLGTVMQEALPENPYNGSNAVVAATSVEAAARTVGGAQGWRYYVDNTTNPPVYTFYPNSDVADENEY